MLYYSSEQAISSTAEIDPIQPYEYINLFLHIHSHSGIDQNPCHSIRGFTSCVVPRPSCAMKFRYDVLFQITTKKFKGCFLSIMLNKILINVCVRVTLPKASTQSQIANISKFISFWQCMITLSGRIEAQNECHLYVAYNDMIITHFFLTVSKDITNKTFTRGFQYLPGILFTNID